MGHTTTTTTISVPLQVSYTCSKCGKPNKQISVVSEWADSMRKGTIHRQATYDKMADESHERAEYRIGRRLDQIVDEAKNNQYRRAELKCKCSHCGYVEPWAKMRFSKFEGCLAYPTVMMVFIALACFFSKSIAGGLGVGLCVAVILGIWFSFKKFRYDQLEKRIASLPKKSLPTLELVIDETAYVLNPETEKAKKQEAELKKARSQTPKKQETNSDITKPVAVVSKQPTVSGQGTIFCRKCGAKILSDSAFCEKCGEKIVRP